jgi:lactoylglutathione lyase
MRGSSIVLALLVSLGPRLAVADPAPAGAPAAGADAAGPRLAYVMVFVSDMKRSVAFYRDQMGLKLRFSSPLWSEFDTGSTTLALHPAGPDNKAGTSQVCVTVEDLSAFYAARKAAGVTFAAPPTPQHYGSALAVMRDPDGALISVGGR